MNASLLKLVLPLTCLGLLLSLSATAETLTYTYDPNGNLLIRQSPSRTETAGVDALDRITLDGTGDGLQRQFHYDANGNRIQYDVDTTQETLTYTPNSNRLIQRGSQVIQLDTAGNTTNDGQYQYVYNNEGRLKQVKQGSTVIASYTYNANGQRTRKVNTSGTTVYHYDLQGQLISETTATGTPQRDYVWLEDRPLTQIDKSTTDTVTYLHTDHLNTPRLATNNQGTVTWTWQAEAFGSNLPHEDVEGDALNTNINLRFPGQYYDQETAFFYNWNRYYDPRVGRYVTSDPIGLDGGVNTYAYVGNDPLRFVDQSGLVCTAVGGTVMCTPPGGTTVSFPRPTGWPDSISPSSTGYHGYDIPVAIGCADPASVLQGLINLPTPGSPQPATPQGTLNDATPTTANSVANFIDWLSSFGNDPGGYNNSPVISYRNDDTVVNVTQPGHPLFPGYVVRNVSGGAVHNRGEGTGWPQASYSPIAKSINNVWQEQTQGIINNSKNGCGCQR